MIKTRILTLLLCAVISSVATQAHGVMISLSDGTGLSGELEFTLVNPTTLEVRAKNTSTGAPVGFDSAAQLLTSVSWDFQGATTITGGSVMTGPTSASVGFSVSNVGSSEDVSGEYGFGNGGGTGLFNNFISTNQAGTTPFGGPNLDGPAVLNGPQAGLVASPPVVALGGQGAIQDEWIATLTLSTGIADLGFLTNGVIIEFGSDAAFIPEPTAATMILPLVLLGFVLRRK